MSNTKKEFKAEKDNGKSSSEFDKIGPYRTDFEIKSTFDLRKNVQARWFDAMKKLRKGSSRWSGLDLFNPHAQGWVEIQKNQGMVGLSSKPAQ
ncbi:unnamed protein product [Dovyalis caffra]|uniref:Uncharacterized protein n=1 Tax=Dovyalis caffra TaxID=77055 RepID=A0AAV1QLK8_9ROSI|nr:unnamed protein product [Dovyalis caffra]